MIHVAFFPAPPPLGPMAAAATDCGLAALLFQAGASRARAAERAVRAAGGGPFRTDPGPLLSEAFRQLVEYFGERRAAFDLPLDLRGTPFQRAAWKALLAIPPGATLTYGGQAARIGRPGAARAVGRANAANPVAVIVPCHRVVAARGSLGGYASGLERKQWLLDLEQRILARRSGDVSQIS